ncbi:50S ribosomal protein L13 [candidate division KSB1 bacterium 4484_188]|nr:MAG: 50S ribosomal protein L13 [candidate division KSB1 bacterium 4484_188]
MLRTDYLKPDEVNAQRKWLLLDAEGQVLGRLATRIATILRGKHKAAFAPHQDVGDFVVVINAKNVKLTGNKVDQKYYFHHSGYPGGDKYIPYRRMMERHPERVIEHAVRLMLPKNALGRQMLKKLKVYAGAEHPHQAQNPQEITL